MVGKKKWVIGKQNWVSLADLVQPVQGIVLPGLYPVSWRKAVCWVHDTAGLQWLRRCPQHISAARSLRQSGGGGSGSGDPGCPSAALVSPHLSCSIRNEWVCAEQKIVSFEFSKQVPHKIDPGWQITLEDLYQRIYCLQAEKRMVIMIKNSRFLFLPLKRWISWTNLVSPSINSTFSATKLESNWVEWLSHD